MDGLNAQLTEKDQIIGAFASVVNQCVKEVEQKNWHIYMRRLHAMISEVIYAVNPQSLTTFFKKENLDQQHEVSS